MSQAGNHAKVRKGPLALAGAMLIGGAASAQQPRYAPPAPAARPQAQGPARMPPAMPRNPNPMVGHSYSHTTIINRDRTVVIQGGRNYGNPGWNGGYGYGGYGYGGYGYGGGPAIGFLNTVPVQPYAQDPGPGQDQGQNTCQAQTSTGVVPGVAISGPNGPVCAPSCPLDDQGTLGALLPSQSGGGYACSPIPGN